MLCTLTGSGYYYRGYGDRRAHKVSSKSFSESKLFSSAQLGSRLGEGFRLKKGAWSLLNHFTSHGSFWKINASMFFPAPVHTRRRGRQKAGKNGACVCAKVARHANVNEDEEVMEAVAANKQPVQGENGAHLLHESGHAKQTWSATSEPAENVTTDVA